MSRTTDHWEALLEGTSSSNWVVGVGGVEVFAVTDHSRSFVADAGSHLLSRQGEALTEARKDAALIAAAPDAVAEVVRLRRELETLAEWHDTKAMKARNYPAPGEETEAERAARVHETARDKITRTLDQEDADD